MIDPYYRDDQVTIYHGDCVERMRLMDAQSVNCCVTSPPYFGLRDYGCAGQIGLEETPDAFVQKLVEVFREVKRVLRDDGTLWLNLGDSYNANQGSGFDTNGDGGARKALAASPKVSSGGLPAKNLLGIPWRVAFALQADGWYLRQDIIWHKPNPMPESVKDRCTKAHEYIFLLSKSPRYYFDHEAIREEAVYGGNEARYERALTADKSLPTAERNGIRPRSSWKGSEFHTGKTGGHQLGRASKKRSGNKERKSGSARGCPENTRSNVFGSVPREGETRNKRSVWSVTSKPYKEAHFATFPPDLIVPCILAGCPEGGKVLDPFGGSGTTGAVARDHGRAAVLCELNEEYIQLQLKRFEQGVLL